MSDRLIEMDYERKKVIVMRTFTDEDGNTYEKEVELDLPQPPMAEGKIRKYKRGEDGLMYEVEEIIRTPLVSGGSEKEEE